MIGRFRYWLRPIAIGFIVLATWFTLGVLTFQGSPNDTPTLLRCCQSNWEIGAEVRCRAKGVN
jgi:hypothetical protein